MYICFKKKKWFQILIYISQDLVTGNRNHSNNFKQKGAYTGNYKLSVLLRGLEEQTQARPVGVMPRKMPGDWLPQPHEAGGGQGVTAAASTHASQPHKGTE